MISGSFFAFLGVSFLVPVLYFFPDVFVLLLSAPSDLFGVTLLLWVDVWGTNQPAHGYSLSKRAAVEAGAEAEGELGQLWSSEEDPLSWSEVAARGKEGLGIWAHLGSSSCSCPGSHWIVPFSFSALAVCWKFTYSVEYQSLVPFCAHPLALAGTSQWCFPT